MKYLVFDSDRDHSQWFAANTAYTCIGHPQISHYINIVLVSDNTSEFAARLIETTCDLLSPIDLYDRELPKALV